MDAKACPHIRILTGHLPNEAKLHRCNHQGKNGSVLVAQFLLERQADVDYMDDSGDFPLMEATRDSKPQKASAVVLAPLACIA